MIYVLIVQKLKVHWFPYTRDFTELVVETQNSEDKSVYCELFIQQILF